MGQAFDKVLQAKELLQIQVQMLQDVSTTSSTLKMFDKQ